ARRELTNGGILLGGLQIFQNASLVRFAAFLAELELPFDRFDLHFETDDPTDHAVNVTVWKLREIVGRLHVTVLEFRDKLRQQVVQRFLVRDRSQRSAGVRDGKVPRRDGLRFRVPGGRDIRVRPAKDDNGRLAAIKGFALWIAARDVAENRSV